MNRYQPADQQRGSQTTYRIADCKGPNSSPFFLLPGYTLNPQLRDSVLHYLNQDGYSLQHALWASCALPNEWVSPADAHQFARFAQFRNLCLTYPNLVALSAGHTFVRLWHVNPTTLRAGYPCAFIYGA